MTPLEHASDRTRYGGKAAGLAGMVRAGLRVPPGFALSPAELEQLALGATAERSWSVLAGIGSTFAVRSSALDEDSGTASFAGQHATVLGVQSPAALVAAAATVRSSGSASQAYRRARGLDGDSVLAAVVQRLIDPVSSGVLFTRDPLTGDPLLVVEGSWGLGEVVVQGLVTPDRVTMTPTGEVRERATGHKDIRLERSGSEILELPVAEDQREQHCIPDGVLSSLAEHASSCERVAGGPADVEWAWDGALLWLLQCRAITTL